MRVRESAYIHRTIIALIVLSNVCVETKPGLLIREIKYAILCVKYCI
jgi:hypothetical protein